MRIRRKMIFPKDVIYNNCFFILFLEYIGFFSIGEYTVEILSQAFLLKVQILATTQSCFRFKFKYLKFVLCLHVIYNILFFVL